MICISCSTDSTDENTTVNPKLLQRVDFLPGNPNVKHWLFNAKGLLTEIRNIDNVLVESFAYDGNNNMIQNIMYVNGTPNVTFNVGYNLNNFMTHINGSPLNYNASEHKYYYTEGYSTFECFINSDFLFKESHYIYDDTIDQYYTNEYCGHDANGNMTGYTSSSTFGGPNSFYTHNDKINPLRSATISIMRAKSWCDSKFLATSLSSVNNIAGMHYFSEDPESYLYHYDYNSYDLPTQQYCDHYYSGVYENTNVTVKYYYYQGDVLP